MDDQTLSASPAAGDVLALERFLPYRLSVTTNRVSGALARLYQDRFDLSVPEWRVMATLGRFPGLTAGEVAERTAMDKVAVSRAVARLEAAGRLARTPDAADRRRAALTLSEAGTAVYRRIVPLARAYEAGLWQALPAAERDVLETALARVEAAAPAVVAELADMAAPSAD